MPPVKAMEQWTSHANCGSCITCGDALLPARAPPARPAATRRLTPAATAATFCKVFSCCNACQHMPAGFRGTAKASVKHAPQDQHLRWWNVVRQHAQEAGCMVDLVQSRGLCMGYHGTAAWLEQDLSACNLYPANCKVSITQGSLPTGKTATFSSARAHGSNDISLVLDCEGHVSAGWQGRA